MSRPPGLLVFGFGYSARRIGAVCMERGWSVAGTRRDAEAAKALGRRGVRGLSFDGDRPDPEVDDRLRAEIDRASHLLVSVPPDREGDPVLRRFRREVERAGRGKALRWIGLLSTTGVYGDAGGAWVDESTPPAPGLERTRRRHRAEEAWTEAAERAGVPLQIFRIAGIYGPGRSVLDRIRAGTARRILKDGSVFNRVHVHDLAGGVLAGMDRPFRPGVYNLADDLPAPGHEVVAYGARLLGAEPPPLVPFEEAGLSPMGRSFYAEDRRVRNERVKADLGYRFRYPTYREGLRGLLESGPT